MTKDKIKLSSIIDEVEFDYKFNSDNTLSLIDLQKANLGNIESEKFIADDTLAIDIIDRLETYINDYYVNNYRETLIEEYNEYPDETYPSILENMKKYPDVFGDWINLMEAFINPNLFDISDIIENKKITTKCSHCGTRLKKSYLTNYKYYCPYCYEDFYEIEEKGV